MEKQKKLKELLRAAKFTIISVSAGLIDAGSFAIMSLVGVPIVIAQPISLILSVIWNFTINRKVTFKSAGNIKIAMLQVAGFYLVFTPLTTWFSSWAAAEGVDEFIIKAITMVLNLVLEYIFCRYVVFRNSVDTAEKKDAATEDTNTTDGKNDREKTNEESK